MNILEQTEALKDLPDQALIKEMQMPTGMAPPVFITAELKRRQRMRNEFKRREAQDMPTVAEEVVMAAGMPQGGIADAARAMAPKSSIAQNTGMNEMMPAAATRAPQRMAEGGIVRMAKGGRIPVVYNGVGYFLLANGEVQDAAGRAVNPELADKIKSSAGVGAEAFGSQPRYDADQLPFKDDGLTYGAAVLSAADTGVDPFGVPQMMTSEDRDSSSMREAPAGDTSPSITNVSTALEDVMGRELGPPMPEQFSSMNMAPSYDVGELNTVADPEAIPASEQLPTRPMSIEPIYSETARPMFSESAYKQGLESKPDTGEMQRSVLPVLGSDPRISGNTEVGILPRGFQDLRSPQVDLDLVSEADDIAPFDPADIAGAKTYSQLISQAQSGTPVTEAQLVAAVEAGNLNNQQASDIQSMIDNPQYTPSKTEQSIAETDVFSSRAFPETPKNTNLLGPQIAQSVGDYFGGVFGGRTIGEQEAIDQKRLQEQAAFKAFQERGGFSEAVDQSPDPSVYSEAIPEGASTAGFTPDLAKDLPADPTLSQGIASIPDDFTLRTAGDAASNALSFGNVSKLVSDDAGGGGGGGGGIVPTGGAATGLEARIAQMLSDREKDRETDKYMALAQAGLALMASKNPTLGGAIGEAGLAGVGALKKAKSQYDADILGLMGLEEKARSSRLTREAALAKASRPKAMTGTEKVGLLRETGDMRERLSSLREDIIRKGEIGEYNQFTPFTPEQLAEKEAEASRLESRINVFEGMAYPELASIQTVNP